MNLLPHRVVVPEIHNQVVDSSFPGRFLWPWNFAFPFEHVERAIVIGDRFGYKTERVISPPLLPLFLESIEDELADASAICFHIV